ncbi:hypothetical protein [Paraconexibacter algicola]|nr:hypothetical protein [Paraconexibacter algicola]
MSLRVAQLLRTRCSTPDRGDVPAAVCSRARREIQTILDECGASLPADDELCARARGDLP